MPIRRLPPLVVNQIAAGEVIERPASVVKELVENAIDARATRIGIAIEAGGRELIRVSDNGCGIAADELPLAVAPHATSKIESAADLDAIATMGFRGEALASIASVSRLSITSRPASQSEGAMIEAEGARVADVHPAGAPIGTIVAVRNLFFNTPARRKFLKTEQTEASRVVEVVQALALAQPGIAFTLRSDDRVVLELPIASSDRERVIEVLGRELEPELLEVRSDDRGFRGSGGFGIWGLAGKPEIARSTARHLRLYLNGRAISDRSLHHAIKEAYRGLIEPTRSPTIVLFIRIDPAQVDVNVHPAKAEVRFRNQSSVHSAVLGAVRQALRKADLTPGVELEEMGMAPWNGAAALAAPIGTGLPAQGSDPSAAAFVEYFRRLDPTQKSLVYTEVKHAVATDLPELLQERSAAPQAVEVGALPTVRSVTDVLQVHSSYIVTQDEQGILIIDQHALHERVMFERLREKIARGPLESQRLLMPATVEVDRSQADGLEALRPLLARVGIEAEAIGPSAIAIHAFPSFLFERHVEPGEFVKGLLERAQEHGLPCDDEAALHETLDMMACKAAVKAGDRLTPQELGDLLKQRELVERSSNCPHGRPTTLRLSLRDLERQFGRT